jgi:hypothetical protein
VLIDLCVGSQVASFSHHIEMSMSFKKCILSLLVECIESFGGASGFGGSRKGRSEMGNLKAHLVNHV